MNTSANCALIDQRDLSVFRHIPSQSSDADRRSWLALQSATARRFAEYSFLEIGSHLGGSIQPHLIDPRCRRIYSIDARPLHQPDNRKGMTHYVDNSTARMMANLRQIEEAAAQKVQTFDSDAKNVNPKAIADPPHLCFIDGEHTDAAVESDFQFCRAVCHPEAVIYFHDAEYVCGALKTILRRLAAEGARFQAWKMKGDVFAIALGASPVPADATVAPLMRPGGAWLRYETARQWYRKGFGSSSGVWLKKALAPILDRFR